MRSEIYNPYRNQGFRQENAAKNSLSRISSALFTFALASVVVLILALASLVPQNKRN